MRKAPQHAERQVLRLNSVAVPTFDLTDSFGPPLRRARHHATNGRVGRELPVASALLVRRDLAQQLTLGPTLSLRSASEVAWLKEALTISLINAAILEYTMTCNGVQIIKELVS